MKLIHFRYAGRLRSGMIDGDEITLFSMQDGILAFIRRGITPQPTSERVKLEEVEVLAPFTPGKIIGVGRNYADHAKELDNAIPEKPLLFAKWSTSVIASGEPITWHTDMTTQVDYEGELAVIIGKRATKVSEADALNYVFGYAIANDVSARDLQDNDKQWVRAKGLDTFCPFGPVIVSRQDIEDPHALTIVTKLNDDEVQHASTGDMIFKIPQLIAYCSQAFTLEPGDVILTGTPSGVGKAQDPPRFLQDSDVVTISIDGIGELSNPCKVIEPTNDEDAGDDTENDET